jgi:hypothetical protein
MLHCFDSCFSDKNRKNSCFTSPVGKAGLE